MDRRSELRPVLTRPIDLTDTQWMNRCTAINDATNLICGRKDGHDGDHMHRIYTDGQLTIIKWMDIDKPIAPTVVDSMSEAVKFKEGIE